VQPAAVVLVVLVVLVSPQAPSEIQAQFRIAMSS
jgi:hypothetical protein